MDAETWIALAKAALRGSAEQLRDEATKLHTVADYLESIVDQAPTPRADQESRMLLMRNADAEQKPTVR